MVGRYVRLLAWELQKRRWVLFSFAVWAVWILALRPCLETFGPAAGFGFFFLIAVMFGLFGGYRLGSFAGVLFFVPSILISRNIFKTYSFDDMITNHLVSAALFSLVGAFVAYVQAGRNKAEIELQGRIDSDEIFQVNSRFSAMAELAAGVAHEINNPLAILLGNTELLAECLERDVNVAECKRLIESNIVTVDRLKRVVASLRAFSRDASGDPFEVINLEALVESTRQLCAARLQEYDIDFKIDVMGSNLSIECQRVQIIQVLVNIIMNAIDAIQNLPERWITISARVVNDLVEIVLTDSGKGIDPSIKQRVMEPFFTTKQAGKGTGLGLSIAQRIIKMHQGKIEIDHTAVNTTFILRLPIKRSVIE